MLTGLRLTRRERSDQSEEHERRGGDQERYGYVIDLDKSPTAIIEIIHNFRYLIDEVASPDEGGGHPNRKPDEVGTATLLNLILELRREVQALHAKIK
jgi:hypothetical protein